MKAKNIYTPDGIHHGWVIQCPGCRARHVLDGRWSFNGDYERPTFRPSYLQHHAHNVPRCHSFITDGCIRFLGDCEHDLAGQTVNLPELDEVRL